MSTRGQSSPPLGGKREKKRKDGRLSGGKKKSQTGAEKEKMPRQDKKEFQKTGGSRGENRTSVRGTESKQGRWYEGEPNIEGKKGNSSSRGEINRILSDGVVRFF